MPIVCPFNVNLPPRRPLHDVILENFHRYGSAVALEEDNGPDIDPERLTFSEIRQLALNAANNFHKLGYRKNDVIATYLENRIHYAPLLLAISSLGGALTGINLLYTYEELQRQLTDSGSKYILTKAALLENVKKAIQHLPTSQIKYVIIGDRISPDFIMPNAIGIIPLKEIFRGTYNSAPSSVPRIDPERDIVLLPYSSGTTGLPKGMMLTHANFCTQFFYQHTYGAFGDPQRHMVSIIITPFLHLAGFVALIVSLYYGRKSIIMPKYDPLRYLKLVADNKLTLFHCVPSVLMFLAKSPEVDKFDLSSVNAIRFGTSPMGKELMGLLLKRFPNISMIQQGYGMIESGGVNTLSTATNASQYLPTSCGVPVPQTEIKLSFKICFLFCTNQEGCPKSSLTNFIVSISTTTNNENFIFTVLMHQ